MDKSKKLETSYYAYRQNSLCDLPAKEKHFPIKFDVAGFNPHKTFVTDYPWDNACNQIVVYPGFISGGSSDNSVALNVWDFDLRGITFKVWREAALKLTENDSDLRKNFFDCINAAPIERTQNGGLHLGYRIQFDFDNDVDLDGVRITRDNVEAYIKRDAAYKTRAFETDNGLFTVNADRWEFLNDTFNPWAKFEFTPIDPFEIEASGWAPICNKTPFVKKNNVWYIESFERLVDRKGCIVAPSEGYEMLQGEWTKIPVIDNELHKIFLQAALDISYKPYEPTVETIQNIPTQNTTLDLSKRLPNDYFEAECFKIIDDRTLPSKYALDKQLGLESILSGGYKILQKVSMTEWRIQRPKPGASCDDIHGSYNPTTGKYYSYTSNDPNFEQGKTYNSLAMYTQMIYGDLSSTSFTKASAEIHKRAKEEGYGGLIGTFNTVEIKEAIQEEIKEERQNEMKETYDNHVEETVVDTIDGVSVFDDKIQKLLEYFSDYKEFFPTIVPNENYTEFHMPSCILENRDTMLGEWLQLAKNRTSSFQPELAVGSFITTLGAHWARRVFFRDIEGDCVPVLYTIGIADSGQGKGTLLGLIDDAAKIKYTDANGVEHSLKNKQESNLESRVMLEELLESNRKVFWVADEISCKMSEKMNQKGTTTSFSGFLNETYSRACKDIQKIGDGVTRKARRAAMAKELGVSVNTLKFVDFPSLCIYGTTVSDNFSALMSGDSLTNGFFGRVDIITGRHTEKPLDGAEAKKDPIYKRGAVNKTRALDFSSEFVNRWNEAWTVNPDSNTLTDNEKISLIQIFFSQTVIDKLIDFRDRLRALHNALKKNSPLKTKYLRIYEQTLRYAVILACMFHGRDVETKDCDDIRIADWSIALALYQICSVTSFLKNSYTANPEDRCIQLIRKYAVKHRQFEKSALTTEISDNHRDLSGSIYKAAFERVVEMREIELVSIVLLRKDGKPYTKKLYQTTDKLLKSSK